MTTPNFVPRIDGEGLIGAANKRWAGAFFSGRINSRGQTVSLKYFVSDEATRYSMSGMPSGTRPEDGDIVFQYYPTGLFVVINQTQLGNLSGYYGIASYEALTGKIDVFSGSGLDPTLTFGDVTFRPTPNGSGFEVNSAYSGQNAFFVSRAETHFVGPTYLDNRVSGLVLVLDGNNQIVPGNITTGELATLSGMSGNIQDQINALSGGFLIYPGGDNLAIQYKDGTLFGGDTRFKFSKSGAFGFNYDPLRGVFDVRKSASGISLSGSVSLSTVAGPTTRTGNFRYRVYPIVSISGTNYYHTGYLTSTGIGVNGNYNISVAWPAQSGASGYRVEATSGTTTVYETASTGFVDSGVSNVSGAAIPNLWGADLTLDYLSNLYLSGAMFINGHRVVTTGDVITGVGAASGGISEIFASGYSGVTGAVQFIGQSGIVITQESGSPNNLFFSVSGAVGGGVTEVAASGYTGLTGAVHFVGESGIGISEVFGVSGGPNYIAIALTGIESIFPTVLTQISASGYSGLTGAIQLVGESGGGIIISQVSGDSGSIFFRTTGLLTIDSYTGGMTGFGVSGYSGLTGFVQLVGQSGIAITQSSNPDTIYVSLSGENTYVFATGLSGNVLEQYIPLPTGLLGGNPLLLTSLCCSGNDTIVPHQLTGVTSTGFWISFANPVPDNSYKLSVLAASTGLTGFITTLIHWGPYEHVVFVTGNQLISGSKYFNEAIFTSGIAISGSGLRVNAESRTLIGSGGITLDWQNRILTGGSWNAASGFSISGSPIQTGIFAPTGYAMGSIYHGVVSGTVRPVGYNLVTWVGSVEPINALNNDIWIDST